MGRCIIIYFSNHSRCIITVLLDWEKQKHWGILSLWDVVFGVISICFTAFQKAGYRYIITLSMCDLAWNTPFFLLYIRHWGPVISYIRIKEEINLIYLLFINIGRCFTLSNTCAMVSIALPVNIKMAL